MLDALTTVERDHLEDLGADAVEAYVERWCIVMESSASERSAARLAYERTCRGFGAKPVAPQEKLPGVAA